MQRYGPLVTSDALVDSLLLLCEKPASPEDPPEFRDMRSSIERGIVGGLPSSEATPDIEGFFKELTRQWSKHKDIRLNVLTESLMPWSTMSRQEGSLDGKLRPVILMNVPHLRML